MSHTNPSTNDEFTVGGTLDGRYRLTEILGTGGQAIVFKAEDTKIHDNPVVIKTLKATVNDQWSIDKFDEERRALAKLQHVTGVVQLMDKGTTSSGRDYTVLEFLDGPLLISLIDAFPRNLPRTANLFSKITAAVEAAHSEDIFHRDLKPANIIVINPNTKDELVKLIDFGIAKQPLDPAADIQKTTSLVGTPYYLSPNALENKPDPKTDDIYALGMIAYQMLTAQFPISEHDVTVANLRLIQRDIHLYPPSAKNRELPKEVDRIVLKALAENPAERYESAESFADELGRALLSSAVEFTQPVPQVVRSEKRYGVIAVLAFLLLVSAGIGVWSMLSGRKTSNVATNGPGSNANPLAIAAGEAKTANSSSPVVETSQPVAQSTPAPTQAPASQAAIPAPAFSVDIVKQTRDKKTASASFSDTFRADDGIRLNILSEIDGYLRVLIKENSGKVQKVPASKIKNGQAISFPSPRWLYFDNKPGTETLYLVVSKQADSNLDAAALERQAAGRMQFVTENGEAVRIIKLAHE